MHSLAPRYRSPVERHAGRVLNKLIIIDWFALLRSFDYFSQEILGRRSGQSSEVRIESHFGFSLSIQVWLCFMQHRALCNSMPVAYRTRSQAVAVIADHTASQHSRLLRLLTHSALSLRKRQHYFQSPQVEYSQYKNSFINRCLFNFR